MSPRTLETTEKLRFLSEERIMKAALELFSRFGYEKASIRMIANEAGISLGLMYNYFESKEVLLLSLLAKGMADVQETFIVDHPNPTAEERLRSLFEKTATVIRRKASFWKLLYSLRMQPEAVKILEGQINQYANVILEYLELILIGLSFQDAKTEARILFAIVDGACQHFVMDQENYPIENIFNVTLKKYVK